MFVENLVKLAYLTIIELELLRNLRVLPPFPQLTPKNDGHLCARRRRLRRLCDLGVHVRRNDGKDLRSSPALMRDQTSARCFSQNSSACWEAVRDHSDKASISSRSDCSSLASARSVSSSFVKWRIISIASPLSRATFLLRVRVALLPCPL